MPSDNPKGVFRFEGDWDPDLRHRATVGPVLELLDQTSYPAVPHIRRDVGTIEEFEFYLGRWTQRRYAAYPILYQFQFHALTRGGMAAVNRRVRRGAANLAGT